MLTNRQITLTSRAAMLAAVLFSTACGDSAMMTPDPPNPPSASDIVARVTRSEHPRFVAPLDPGADNRQRRYLFG